jgi:hypothetical protein
VAAFLVIASNAALGSAPSEQLAGNRSPALMASTARYMEQAVSQDDLILVDYQSNFPFAYYLCGPKVIFPVEIFRGDYFEFQCNGYSVVSLRIWKLIAESFPGQFEKVARSHKLKPGTRVWVYQTGWGRDLDTDLASHNAEFRCLVPKRFGGGVTVTPFVVGPDFSPQMPPGNCREGTASF